MADIKVIEEKFRIFNYPFPFVILGGKQEVENRSAAF